MYMEGDGFLCKGCHKKWRQEGMVGPKFCGSCYSEEIINLSREERVRKVKEEKESKAREKKERMERLRRQIKRDELKKRQLKRRYSRMKKR